MDNQYILNYVSGIIGIISIILGVINHKRIRSKCCKTELSASLEIDDIKNNSNKDLTKLEQVKIDEKT